MTYVLGLNAYHADAAVDYSRVGIATGDGQGVVGRAAVHDHHFTRPLQSLQRAANIGGFVIGEDDGSDVGQHGAVLNRDGYVVAIGELLGRDQFLSAKTQYYP